MIKTVTQNGHFILIQRNNGSSNVPISVNGTLQGFTSTQITVKNGDGSYTIYDENGNAKSTFRAQPFGEKNMFNYIDLINPIFDRMNVIYYRLHEQVNSLDRYQYDGKNFVNLSNPLSQIPNKQGGIYIIFEKGETYKDFDRIVRVGKAEKSLLTRLTQHFIKKDKDHSVFRKHIGRSLLRQQHCDLEIKDWDTKGVNNIEIEDKVTEHLIENISFCIIPLSDKEQIKKLEQTLLEVLSIHNRLYHETTGKYIQSDNWLGYCNENQKVTESGMWNDEHIRNWKK